MECSGGGDVQGSENEVERGGMTRKTTLNGGRVEFFLTKVYGVEAVEQAIEQSESIQSIRNRMRNLFQGRKKKRQVVENERASDRFLVHGNEKRK